jgi:RND superfamily putative drug exporter
MLARLADLAVRRRRLVLVLAVALIALAGAYGGSAAQELSVGGFEDPSSESSEANRLLEDEFGTGGPNVVLLVSAESGSVDDPAVVRSGTALARRLAAEDGVADVASYWTLANAPPLRSDDGSRALVVARIEGDANQVSERIEELSPEYGRSIEGATVGVGGFAETFRQVGETIEQDLTRAELIALPITLILLLFVFRSLVAALLPLLIGALSVVGTLAVLRLVASVTEVSIFALNLTTALGLGLAIDYSLFIVSRYREELHAGHEPFVAVTRTVRTAGRTIAFSALTVAVSLSALLIFPLSFLRSFAYAGVAVAVLAGLCAVVVLPALLAVLGHRIDALALRRNAPKPVEDGFWYRSARRVMGRPIPVIGLVVTLLLVLGAPFLNLSLGSPDDRVLYSGASSRQVNEVLRDEFASAEAFATTVVAPDISAAGTGSEQTDAIDGYAAGLSLVEGVARVDAVTGVFLDGQKVEVDDALTDRFADDTGTWLSVVPDIEPISAEAERMVADLRAVDAPFPVSVGGASAELVDSKAALLDRVPHALGLIAVATFALLFMMFGSVVVPAKALVLNVLSLTATFGAMVWIFQEGHLSGVLDFTATGFLDATTPILMFCLAFGLSMDYEVFLLSRIKEEHDAGRDNTTSVAVGLERTGRIVTSAAALIAVVFIAFATSRVSFIKLTGVGLALAVLMDAFVIRGTLVPAFMRLAGENNWWAPRPLRRLHDRFGFSEHIDLDAEVDGVDAATPGRDEPAGPDDRSLEREPQSVGGRAD